MGGQRGGVVGVRRGGGWGGLLQFLLRLSGWEQFETKGSPYWTEPNRACFQRVQVLLGPQLGGETLPQWCGWATGSLPLVESLVLWLPVDLREQVEA